MITVMPGVIGNPNNCIIIMIVIPQHPSHRRRTRRKKANSELSNPAIGCAQVRKLILSASSVKYCVCNIPFHIHSVNFTHTIRLLFQEYGADDNYLNFAGSYDVARRGSREQ